MYIYAIGTDEDRQKIGFSSDPQMRLKTLQTGNPEPLHLHYQFPIEESMAAKYEKYVHHQHSHLRAKGEWFRMTPDEVISMMQYHEIMCESVTAIL